MSRGAMGPSLFERFVFAPGLFAQGKSQETCHKTSWLTTNVRVICRRPFVIKLPLPWLARACYTPSPNNDRDNEAEAL